MLGARDGASLFTASDPEGDSGGTSDRIQIVATTLAAVLVRTGGGRLIGVASLASFVGLQEVAAYTASKWGLTGLIKSLAEEGRERGIFCAAVLPGSVQTQMLEQTAFPPRMRPEDVARVVKFLCTDAPFAMTGSAVEVFG